MRVVDSSAWIEWLTNSATGERLAADIPPTNACVVPTIVQFELAKWLTREQGEDASDRFLSYTLECSVVPLDTRIALRAAEVSLSLKLAMADAIVYATALEYEADLLSCDNHFEGLAGVVYIDKG